MFSNLLLEGKSEVNSTPKFITWVIGKTMVPLLKLQISGKERLGVGNDGLGPF